MLVNTYCPELTVFFTMFGETIKSDSVYITESELPNPFGGRSFPTNETTKIDSINDASAIISRNQTIPESELNSIMKETFIELSKKSEKPYKEDEIPIFNMTTSIKFIYNFKKKSLNEVYMERLIEGDGIKQTQTLKVISKN